MLQPLVYATKRLLQDSGFVSLFDSQAETQKMKKKHLHHELIWTSFLTVFLFTNKKAAKLNRKKPQINNRKKGWDQLKHFTWT